MRRTILLLAILAFSASLLLAQSKASKPLDIYVIDVEGGNAVLFVAPSGESMLVDTGNGGDGAVRDAGRILAAVKDAGITQIDHLIITHYHNDHIGGLPTTLGSVVFRDYRPTLDAFVVTKLRKAGAAERITKMAFRDGGNSVACSACS